MTRRFRLGRLTSGLAALCVFAFSGTASAANISSDLGARFQSVQFDRTAVYWFERFTRNGDGGAIYRRVFGTAKAEKVYAPPKDVTITGFKIRNGVIAISQSPDGYEAKESEVDELKFDNGKWTAAPLLKRTLEPAGGNCGTRVRLVGIAADGAVIADDRVAAGLNGSCSIVRESSTVSAYAADGSVTQLIARKSGWSTDVRNVTFERVWLGPGDWAFTSDSYFYDDSTQLGLRNVATGATSQFVLPFESAGRPEVTAAGQTLFNDPNGDLGTTIFTDPLDLTKSLKPHRPGSTWWFHFCGDKLLEISRRKAARKRRAGSLWNLYIRDHDGNVLRRLDQRLPRGTTFGACDAGTAIFHQRFPRTWATRQIVVGLG